MNKINNIKLRKINDDESELEYLKYLKEKCFEFSKPIPRDRGENESDNEYSIYLEEYYNNFYKRLDLLTEIVPLLADYETKREERKRIRKEENIYKPSLVQRFYANKIVRKTKKIANAISKGFKNLGIVSKKVISTIKLVPKKVSILFIKIGRGTVKNTKLGINKITKIVKKPFIYISEKKKEKKLLEEEFVKLINNEKAKDMLNSLEEEVIEDEKDNDILEELYEEVIEEENDHSLLEELYGQLFEEEYDLEEKIIKTTEEELLDLEEETITDEKVKKLSFVR